MALVLSLSTINRDSSKIVLDFVGALDGTPSLVAVSLTFEDGTNYDVNLAPNIYPLPASVPFQYVLNASDAGINEFEDGVYTADVTVDYSDAATEILSPVNILMDINTVESWANVMSKHISLDCICSETPNVAMRSTSRELIQAANEFFEQSKYYEASNALKSARKILKDIL